MKKLDTFQLVLMGIFFALFMAGLLAFSGLLPGFGRDNSNSNNGVTNHGTVVVWGELSFGEMSKVILKQENDKRGINIIYKQIRGDFRYRLLDAMANGNAPDLILLKHSEIFRHLPNIEILNYDLITNRGFIDKYIEAGNIYMTEGGFYALPVSVDPMVMYWNKDIFVSSKYRTTPPITWEDVSMLTPIFTKTSSGGFINKSFVALGGYGNINNAKDILSLLSMQTDALSIKKNNSGVYDAFLGGSGSGDEIFNNLLRFYMGFSDPLKETYTWNRVLPNSKDMFTAGDSAIYFGFASELDSIVKINPHLNFDVAIVPQFRNTDRKDTFSELYGISVVETSKNKNGAFFAASIFAGSEYGLRLSEQYNLVPTQKHVLAQEPNDSHYAIFYKSAVMSKVWLDPNSVETDKIFGVAINNLLSNKFDYQSARAYIHENLKKQIKNK